MIKKYTFIHISNNIESINVKSFQAVFKKVYTQSKKLIVSLGTRDGHAYAAMSDSCRMMRICAYAYACRQKKSDVAKREK